MARTKNTTKRSRKATPPLSSATNNANLAVAKLIIEQIEKDRSDERREPNWRLELFARDLDRAVEQQIRRGMEFDGECRLGVLVEILHIIYKNFRTGPNKGNVALQDQLIKTVLPDFKPKATEHQKKRLVFKSVEELKAAGGAKTAALTRASELLGESLVPEAVRNRTKEFRRIAAEGLSHPGSIWFSSFKKRRMTWYGSARKGQQVVKSIKSK